MNRIRTHLSFANLVATLALFIALGGSSYAAFSMPKNSVGTKQLKRGAVTTAKVKDGAVTARKLNTAGVTVPNALHANSTDSAAHAATANNASHAGSADNATTAGHADNATTAGHAGAAVTAANAQPVAFAHVDFHHVLDQANSKNVGAMTFQDSTYCFHGIPFTIRGGQATADGVDSGQSAQFGLGDASGFCPAGTQAFVVALASNSPQAFFVTFYG